MLEDNINVEDISSGSFLTKTAQFLKSMVISDKKIGDLNGKWAGMFKLLMAAAVIIIPTAVSWGFWVSSNVYKNGVEIKKLDEVLPKVEHLQERDVIHDAWELRLSKLEQNANALNKKVVELDKNNTQQHEHISTQLDGVKQLLEYLKDK